MRGPWYLVDDMAAAAGLTARGVISAVRAGQCPEPDRRDDVLRWSADRPEVRAWLEAGSAADRRTEAVACVELLVAKHGSLAEAARRAGVARGVVYRLMTEPGRRVSRDTVARLQSAAGRTPRRGVSRGGGSRRRETAPGR